jgi:hypothetical protein
MFFETAPYSLMVRFISRSYEILKIALVCPRKIDSLRRNRGQNYYRPAITLRKHGQSRQVAWLLLVVCVSTYITYEVQCETTLGNILVYGGGGVTFNCCTLGPRT